MDTKTTNLSEIRHNETQRFPQKLNIYRLVILLAGTTLILLVAAIYYFAEQNRQLRNDNKLLTQKLRATPTPTQKPAIITSCIDAHNYFVEYDKQRGVTRVDVPITAYSPGKCLLSTPSFSTKYSVVFPYEWLSRFSGALDSNAIGFTYYRATSSDNKHLRILLYSELLDVTKPVNMVDPRTVFIYPHSSNAIQLTDQLYDEKYINIINNQSYSSGNNQVTEVTYTSKIQPLNFYKNILIMNPNKDEVYIFKMESDDVSFKTPNSEFTLTTMREMVNGFKFL